MIFVIVRGDQPKALPAGVLVLGMYNMNRKRSQVLGSPFSAASDRRSGQFDRKRDFSVAESHTRVPFFSLTLFAGRLLLGKTKNGSAGGYHSTIMPSPFKLTNQRFRFW